MSYFESDFLFIPGAAKSGTSSLFDYLKNHPQIAPCQIKEPHFFSTPDRFDSGKFEGIEYQKLFDTSKKKIPCDASTSYMISDYAIRNIQQNISNPKFIFVLRNPIDRTISHYKWLVGIDEEKKTFRKAIKSGLTGEFDFHSSPTHRYKYYLELSYYHKWLRKYFKLFGKENILILTTEDLKMDPQKCLNRCTEFLDIKEMTIEKSIMSNKSRPERIFNPRLDKLLSLKFHHVIPQSIRSWVITNLKDRQKTNIKEKDRNYLKNLFEEDVKYLKKLTNLDFEEWREFQHLK